MDGEYLTNSENCWENDVTLTWLFTLSFNTDLLAKKKKSAVAELKVEAEKSVLGCSAIASNFNSDWCNGSEVKGCARIKSHVSVMLLSKQFSLCLWEPIHT